jgi:hypothetical protein
MLEGEEEIARYVEKKGWIAEAAADHGIFVMSALGNDEAMS